MPAKAEVTTIIRTYNRCAKTLCAIDSVINQSLDGQLIVLVDDGSTDQTAEVVHKTFGSRVAIIRHKENKGVGAAANTGLAAVKTPFAAFLDSDDVWEQGFLETMLSSIKSHPGATLAYCDLRFEFPDHDLDYAVRAKEVDAISDRLMPPPFTMSSVLVRTRSAKSIGSIDETKKIGEDSDFYIRLWLRAPKSFVHVRQNLVRHRIWSGNTTTNLNLLIKELDLLTRQYLRHPYYSHLTDSYTEVVRQRLLGVAARHQVYKWLSVAPKRPMSLIVTDVNSIDDTVRSLDSAADQRIPPIDVAIICGSDSPLTPELQALALREWPFTIHIVYVKKGGLIGENIQYSLNVLIGSAVLFLKAGEEFLEGALDAHRHALSCSPQTVLMSYGGTIDRIPDSLPVDKSAMAIRTISRNIPGNLATVAISRKALIVPNIIPKHREHGFCLHLMLSLLSSSGPVVRVAKPVVRACEQEIVDQETLKDILRDVSETDAGHWIIGALDDALDRTEHDRDDEAGMSEITS